MIVVGIDVGGTFTDVTAVDDATGAVRLTKVPSTPRDEARAVLRNAILDALAPRGINDLPLPATPERIWRAIREQARG